MRIQKPIKNRTRVSSGLARKIAQRVESEAAHYDVSKSFVIANALAFAFGISIEDTYKNSTVRPRLVSFRRN